jgi:hypothetical protein
MTNARVSFRLVFFTLLLALTHIPTAWAVGVVQVTGSLPRDPSSGWFDLSVKVTEVPSTEAGDATAALAGRLTIVLPDNSSEALPTVESSTTAAQPFFIELRDDEVAQTPTATNGNLDLVWLIRVYQGSGFTTAIKDLIEKSDTKDKIKVIARYTYKEDKTDSSTTEIKVKIAVANEAPESLSSVGTEQTLAVSWVRKAQIAWSGKDVTADAPGEAVIFAIRRSAGGRSLTARTFNENSVSDVATVGGCTYDATHANGAECVSCPSPLDYLDVEALRTSDPDNVIVVSSSGQTASISGLENEAEYSVFAMYKPDGIKRSACLVGIPSANFTWSELNGEGKARAGSFKCFVATAAWGSPLNVHVETLRWFRDRHLLTNAAGRWFVETYYRLSPPLAEIIETRPWLAGVTRAVLWGPVKFTAWLRQNSTGGSPSMPESDARQRP